MQNPYFKVYALITHQIKDNYGIFMPPGDTGLNDT